MKRISPSSANCMMFGEGSSVGRMARSTWRSWKAWLPLVQSSRACSKSVPAFSPVALSTMALATVVAAPPGGPRKTRLPLISSRLSIPELA